ncbi:hypothetical protein E3N88_23534 [Mikania micrantha]|uniref:Uncharacterized protein n=1 Tax=Mikania micrantha TaxID=192012 RepID=A0A5N6NF98_9ASTR|nr:hypothetical protein E3N88_23534 [Mikania micrantha]
MRKKLSTAVREGFRGFPLILFTALRDRFLNASPRRAIQELEEAFGKHWRARRPCLHVISSWSIFILNCS